MDRTQDRITNHIMPKGINDALDYDADIDHGPYGNKEGKIIANPGTEYTVLEFGNIRLITFVSNFFKGKQMFGMVELGELPRSIGGYVDSNYNRLTLVARDVFTIMATAMLDSNNHTKQLKAELEQVKLERDLYKGTIDTLRNNGVIE